MRSIFIFGISFLKAYFINGPRDNEFERSFKKILINGAKLKVFTRVRKDKPAEWASCKRICSQLLFPFKHNTSTRYSFKPDLAEDVEVKIYSEQTRGEDGRPVIGIKDLLDSHDDYHNMQFIKYEMNSESGDLGGGRGRRDSVELLAWGMENLGQK